MSHRDDLDFSPSRRVGRPEACSAWALLLVDAAEGLLSEAEQAVLDRHVAACAGCAQELADAQRGAAWLGLLKGHTPEPSPALLNNILAKTTGTVAVGISSPAPLADSVAGATWMPAGSGVADDGSWSDRLPWGVQPHGLSAAGERLSRWFGTGSGAYVPALQPRLAMTSAMAFFSICLTLNLLGLSVHSLRAEALRPAGLQRTVADTGASLVRSFEGIRMVYRVESRVNQWRTASAVGNNLPLEGAR